MFVQVFIVSKLHVFGDAEQKFTNEDIIYIVKQTTLYLWIEDVV